MALTPAQRKFVLRFYSSFPADKEDMFFELAKNRLVDQGGNIGEVPKPEDKVEEAGLVKFSEVGDDDPVPPMIVKHTDMSGKPSPDTKRGVPFVEGDKLPVINKTQVKTTRVNKKKVTDIKTDGE